MDEHKMKHLEMIQNIVNRMANNSFYVKGWTVTLVAALFALAQKDSSRYFLCIPCFPVIAFWVLDSYFLWQERLFRKLYDKVRVLDNAQVDFDMNISPFVNQNKSLSWGNVFWSKTLLIFYGAIFICILSVITILL